VESTIFGHEKGAFTGATAQAPPPCHPNPGGVIAQGDRISIEDLPERVRDTEPTTQVDVEPARDGEINLKAEMQRHEADLLLKALRQCDWDRKKAAMLLGLPIRTLAHKMQVHGIRKTSYEKAD